MKPPDGNNRRDRADQRGFALLLLLGLMGVGSVAVLFAVQALLSPSADRTRRTDSNLATVQQAARESFRTLGSFPAGLSSVASASGLPAQGGWRLDPHSAALDLDYAVNITGVRVRSRGSDRQLGTADDVAANVVAEPLVRVRQRTRLRLLRAALLRSPYRYDPSMGAAVTAAMRDAARDYAAARRAWLTADAAQRVVLQARMTSASSAIAGACAAYALPPLPAQLTGIGGLMQQLGMPDSKCVDGIGRAFARDATVGFSADGYDRIGATDDDM